MAKTALPLTKKKLINHPELRCDGLPLGQGSLYGSRNPCPQCGGECYSFDKDLGAIDYYENTWTVCTNPPCAWRGEHTQVYERGPY
jgi:hypothetical protein